MGKIKWVKACFVLACFTAFFGLAIIFLMAWVESGRPISWVEVAMMACLTPLAVFCLCLIGWVAFMFCTDDEPPPGFSRPIIRPRHREEGNRNG